jgi:Zn-dependent protease with chaperone function
VHAWRRRSIAVVAAGMGVLVFIPSGIAWALPLLLLAYLAGGFPARRALFGETWGFAAYLAHVVRMLLAFGGFWLLVMAAPGIVDWARPREWTVAGALSLLLLAWGFLHDRVLLRLLRAAPLKRPDLTPRLEAIAAESTAPMPRLFVIGPPEARWANALALPSTGRPAVAFTRTLLEMLEADEIAAIFAHEQAHLEHFHRGRVIRLGLIQAAVVLLGTVGAAAAFSRLGSAPLAVTVGWPLVVGLGLVVRVARHQAHEAESDRRAAELCGDPAALGRGLVTLHQLALFPRRQAPEHEHWESHPSLASRLRALRALADQHPGDVVEASGPPPSDVCLAGAAPGAWLVLEREQAHWLEGVTPETPREPGSLRDAAPRGRSLAYGELVELRLQPRGRDGHVVVATDRAGASWSLALAPGEGHAAQVALDAVDHRLSPTSAAPRTYRLVASLVAAAGTLMALLAFSAALVPGFVALVLTHPGPLAALGTGLVVSALISPPDGPGLLEGTSLPLRIAALLVPGVCALGLAWATAWRERARRTRSAPWVGLLLSLAAALPLIIVLAPLFSGSLLSLHLAAGQHPSATILLASAAAAFVVSPRRWSRALGVGAAVLSVLALVVASGAFAARFVHDPLWTSTPPSPGTSVALRLVAEQPLPEQSRTVSLSPTGCSWVARGYDPDANPGTFLAERIVVGSAHGTEQRYEALDVVLLDDERLLALREHERGLALVCGPHDPSAAVEWRHPLPGLSSPRLAVDVESGAWRVVGVDPDGEELLRLVGNLEGDPPEATRWSITRLSSQWVVGAGPAALGVDLGPEEGDWPGEDGSAVKAVSGLWWLLAGEAGTRLLALDAGGHRPLLDSQLRVQCDEPPPGVRAFVCRAHDGQRSWLWSVDPVSGERQLLGAVQGFAMPPRPAARGGVLLVHEDRGQSLYRLANAGPVRLRRGEDPRGAWALDATGFAEGVGLLIAGAQRRPRLRLYEEESGSATP